MVEPTLLNYVKEVYALESEQYTLTQILKELKRKCSWNRNQIRAESVNCNYSHGLREEKSTTGAKVKIGVGIFIAVGGLATASGIMILYFIVAFFFIAYGVADISEANSIIEENARKRQEIKENADKQLANIR